MFLITHFMEEMFFIQKTKTFFFSQKNEKEKILTISMKITENKFIFPKSENNKNWKKNENPFISISPGQQLEVWDIRRVLNNIFYHWLNQNLCFEHPLFSLSFFQKIMFFVFFFVVEAKMTFLHQIRKQRHLKKQSQNMTETKSTNKTKQIIKINNQKQTIFKMSKYYWNIINIEK